MFNLGKRRAFLMVIQQPRHSTTVTYTTQCGTISKHKRLLIRINVLDT